MRATTRPAEMDGDDARTLGAVDVLTIVVVLATLLALGVLARSAHAYGNPPTAETAPLVDG